MVRGTVEETLNAMLDAEAERLCGAGRSERSEARQDTRAGSYERTLHTKAGRVVGTFPDGQDTRAGSYERTLHTKAGQVVGAFPDGQSCLNLAAARLRYIAGSAWSAK